MPSENSSTIYIHIPDLLRNWPWPRRLSPHYAVCKEESSAWCESFNAFNHVVQSVFNRSNTCLLGSLTYPTLDKDGCRVGCDVMYLFAILDEYTDTASEKVAREQADITMDALRNPSVSRPAGEWVGGEIARQFWSNASKIANDTAQRHFIDAFQLFTDSLVKQAEDRAHNRVRDIKGYFDIRRYTVGAWPCFAILEFHMELPDEVLQDSTIERLAVAGIDLIIIANDIYSYNVEQARGDDEHNLVTVVMDELHTDIHGALEWISKLNDRVVAQFLSDFSSVDSFGDPNLDAQVASYIYGIANWVRAHDCWSFEGLRYFGTKGLEIQRSRVLALLPKQHPNPRSNV